MSDTIKAQLSALKKQLVEQADAKAWSVLWIVSAIEFTAMFARSSDVVLLALGAMRDPALRAIAPSILNVGEEAGEEAGEETGAITSLTPFVTRHSDAANSAICAISAYVAVLCELQPEESSLIMREAYDACISTRRTTSRRVLGWLKAESDRRGLAWPPPRVKRDYASLCAVLAED